MATSAQRQQEAELFDLRPPSPWLLAMEFRAPWEFGALLPTWPVLMRAPRGDGHTVIVLPGLGASDASTVPLRRFLQTMGYDAHGWSQGFNFGPRAGVLDSMSTQVQSLAQESGRKVSLVGWSLGGIYAREIAKLNPSCVRSVATLGTPFAGPPRSTNAWRIYELVSNRNIERERHNFNLPEAPPVPTSSLYSRTDGIVAWKGSVQAQSAGNPHTENIEVLASHMGIGVNPSAWWALADRLSQAEGAWQRFQAPRMMGLQGLVFPDPTRA